MEVVAGQTATLMGVPLVTAVAGARVLETTLRAVTRTLHLRLTVGTFAVMTVRVTTRMTERVETIAETKPRVMVRAAMKTMRLTRKTPLMRALVSLLTLSVPSERRFAMQFRRALRFVVAAGRVGCHC